jgi:hypothetical protein
MCLKGCKFLTKYLFLLYCSILSEYQTNVLAFDAELAYTEAQMNYLEAVYDDLSAKMEMDRTMGVVGKN